MSNNGNTVNIEIQNNLIKSTKELLLTAKDVEDKLATFSYTGMGREKANIVEHTELPKMALDFYEFVFEYGNIPSENEFVELYFNKHFKKVDNKITCLIKGKLESFDYDDVLGRVLRSYPSFVRDIHFYLLLKESNLFNTVYYRFDWDYFKGIDIAIKHKNQWFYIALMQDSEDSNKHATKKSTTRRKLPDGVIKLKKKLPANFSKNKIFLFGDDYLLKVKNEIDKRLDNYNSNLSSDT